MSPWFNPRTQICSGAVELVLSGAIEMTNGLGPARNFRELLVRVTNNRSSIVRVRNFAEFDRSKGRSRRSFEPSRSAFRSIKVANS